MRSRTVSAIAHRGFSAAAPENTLAAFQKAIDLGAEITECDVRKTRDGKLVVIHDETVNRTTNGKGAVSDMTLEQIQNLDAGSWFGQGFAGERIPSLEQLLDLTRDNIKLMIEIKEEGLEDDVVAMIQNREMQDQVILASFYERIGMRIPELDEGIPFLLLLFRPEAVGEEESAHLADDAALANASIFGVNYRAISPALIKSTHAANIHVMAWTVDDAADMRAMVDMGVDIIASNKTDVLIHTLTEMGVRPDHGGE